MKESSHFMYDGISSKDMGVQIAWDSSGLYEDIFLPEREIKEIKIPNREKPYFQGVEHKPLSFSLSFLIEDYSDNKKLTQIAEWFFKPTYKPLIFDVNPNRVFYAMFEGSSNLKHIGLKAGLVELDIRCDSPYGYSHERTKENIEFRNSNVGSKVEITGKKFDEGTLENITLINGAFTVGVQKNTWGNLKLTTRTWGELK